MTRHSTLLLATLLLGPGLTACDKGEAPQADATKPAAAAQPDEAQPDAPAAQPDPSTAKPEARTVASGLDLGQRFAAFDIINCDSGDQYCQVCKYGPNPKIMAVGTLDDEAFRKDLAEIDALVAKYGEDKVRAFAVIADSKDGALVTPIDNREDMQAKAKALRTELGLSMPVVVPAPKDGGQNGTFEDHYQIKQSRTIMFADGRNLVKYSEVAPADKSGLEQAIKAVIGT